MSQNPQRQLMQQQYGSSGPSQGNNDPNSFSLSNQLLSQMKSKSAAKHQNPQPQKFLKVSDPTIQNFMMQQSDKIAAGGSLNRNNANANMNPNLRGGAQVGRLNAIKPGQSGQSNPSMKNLGANQIMMTQQQQQNPNVRNILGYNSNTSAATHQKTTQMKNGQASGAVQFQSPSLTKGGKIGQMNTQSQQNLQQIPLQGDDRIGLPRMDGQYAQQAAGEKINHHKSHQLLMTGQPNNLSTKGFQLSKADQELLQRSPNKRIGNAYVPSQNKMNFQNQQKYLNQINLINQNLQAQQKAQISKGNITQGKNKFNVGHINSKNNISKKTNLVGAAQVAKDAAQTQIAQLKPVKNQSQNQKKSRNVMNLGGIGTVEEMLTNSSLMRGNNVSGYIAHNQTQHQIQQHKQLNLNNQSFEGDKSNIQSQTQVVQGRSNSQQSAQTSGLNLPNNRGVGQVVHVGASKKGQKNAQKNQYEYDLSCYNDTENSMVKRKETGGGTQKNAFSKAGIGKKNNSDAVPLHNGSMSQTDLHPTNGEFQQIMNDLGNGASRNQFNNVNKNSKTLYTNISLRELSQSPNNRRQSTSGVSNQNNKNKAKKIMIGTGSKNGNNANSIQQSQQNKGQPQVQQNNSGNVQNRTYEFSNQEELKEYLNNINQSANPGGPQTQSSQNQTRNTQILDQNNQQYRTQQPQTNQDQMPQGGTQANSQQQASTQNDNGQNGAILNIKTVQDINIYNNSFIVNTHSGQIPQNLQNHAAIQIAGQDYQNQQQQQQEASNAMENSDAPAHNSSSQGQQTAATEVKKGGLKLRKEIRGLSNGFNQSRSASQGRGQLGGDGSLNSSQQAVNPQNQSRNNGSLTEHNTYGTNNISVNEQNTISERISKVFDAYNTSNKEIVISKTDNVMNHVLSAQNIKNYAQNPNQKRIISNPSGKLFGNVGAIQGISKNLGGSQSQKQKYQLAQQQQAQMSYYTNQPKVKQGFNKVLKKGISPNTYNNTSRLQSRTSSRATNAGGVGAMALDEQQQLNAINQLKKDYNKLAQRQNNNAQGQNNILPPGRININHPGQGTGNLTSHGLGIRATSQFDNNRQHHNTQLQLMNIHDLGAVTTESRIMNKSNLSNLTAHDLNESNLHSNSQMILSQLHSSQNYNKHLDQQILKQANQLINTNSHEVRKQSLQEFRTNQNHLANQPKKFRNQVNQNSAEINGFTGTPLRTAQIGQVGANNGQINYSMNVKNEQYFQNRGGIMSRIKTQDAISTADKIFGDKISPICLQQEQQAVQVARENQNKLSEINQSVIKIKKKIQDQKDNFLKEADLKLILTQLDQFQTKITLLKDAVYLAKNTYKDISSAQQIFDSILQKIIESNQEATFLRALTQVDLGQNHESLESFQTICGIQQLMNDFNGSGSKAGVPSDQIGTSEETSDMLLMMNLNGSKPQNQVTIQKQADKQKLQLSMLMRSIIYKRVGEHEKATQAITDCITKFTQFKDGYLLRGQLYLIQKKTQKAIQDFIKFDQQLYNEIEDLEKAKSDNTNNIQVINFKIWQLKFQMVIGKESLGDGYKKMKKYKQASQSYTEAFTELQNLQKQINKNDNNLKNKSETFLNKLKMKIAMSDYYQGKFNKVLSLFQDLIDHYQKYDSANLKVQHKQLKCNYYYGKALLSLADSNQNTNYQEALFNLSFCCKEEFDPELHELYTGNATFEISKIFFKQKDILNAHEFIQRATDNNYNSKRLSLYRDFAEGIVYLMKRKIKKGVQILSDLLEIMINGQREIAKNEKSKADGKNGEPQKTEVKQAQDRYQVLDASNDSKALQDHLNNAQLFESNDGQSTITGKANQIASGKFNKEMYDYLIFYIYIYRSYGYVAIEKYEHALEDLRKAKKIQPDAIDQATIYNKWLSRGILKMDTEEYLMASKYFGKASMRFPENKDAFCLNVISIVRSYTYSMSGQFIDEAVKSDKIIQTKNFLDVAIQCCCKEQKQSSLYFFRGLLHYQLHNFYDALNDFNIAIQEEEEPSGQFHLARGRCYACLSILDESLKDLSIALELDETLLEAYIFRGKCAYLLGDNNLAFHDFQKLIISDQKNPIVHIYAGNLLMTTGAYKDAIKAFDNADTVHQTALASFQRIRCYCALSDLESAFEQMQLCMHLAPKEKFAQYDYKVLLPLLSCVRSFAFVTDENDNQEKGYEEQMEILRNCVNQITSIIAIYEKGEQNNLKKSESPMSIQIIPNVNKIKIEKLYAAQYIIRGDSQESSNQAPIELSKEERQRLDEAEQYGYYRENIFQLEEMYLYRSIFHTYLGNYDEAMSDLSQSRKQHMQISQAARQEAKSTTNKGKKDISGIETGMSEEMYGKFPASQLVSPIASVHSHHSYKTDLSDIGLCSLNVKEFNYNLLIVLIQKKKWDQALAKVNELISSALNYSNTEFAKNIKQLYIVRAMIYLETGQQEKYNQDLTIYMKNFQKIVKNSHNAVVIEPFDVKGRLCQYFEPVKMNFAKPKTKSGFNIWMKFSFSMPFVKPPNMIPNIDEETVQNEFNLKQIDAPMPEAPWQRTCSHQNFEPFNYLQDEEQDPQEDGEPAKPKKPAETKNPKKANPSTQLKLPFDSSTQQFLRKYFQSNQPNLILDEKLIEDIDDLSDMDKVSLISDIYLENKNKDGESTAKGDKTNLGKDKSEEALNLKGIDQINKELRDAKKNNVQVVHNGLQMNNHKYVCKRKSTCHSCHRLPTDPCMQNISDQNQLIANLRLTEQERLDINTERYNKYQKLAPQADKDKTVLQGYFSEDTVSEEEEYGSSSDEDKDSENNSRRHGSKVKKGKGKKKEEKSKDDGGSSKYTHSRFSSNIGDLEDELERIEMMNNIGNGIGGDPKNIDINAEDIQIQASDRLPSRKLIKNDNRNNLQMLGRDASPEIYEKELDKDMKEKIFNQRIGSIGSIQQQAEPFLADENSPIQINDSPLIKKAKENKVSKGSGVDHAQMERDSMVVMGSKNMDKVQPKKKSKIKGGLGGLNNLKKNKLAIAFNNLEVEQQNGADD